MARKTTTTRSSLPDNARVRPAVGEEQIRLRAYELYQKRQGNHGDAESDWYRAEAELREDEGQRQSDAARPMGATLT
jgi:hypothetical protein